jgi:small subunit ribosomal protein S3
LIERKGDDKTSIAIRAAKPGVIIGRQGAGIEEIKKKLTEAFKRTFFIDILEVKSPDMDAQLVAENIAAQLEKRISFRRAMKQCMSRTMKSGAKGIKTQVTGRLGGAEIARREHYHEGTIPLQTLRADIDYGFAEADTTYGRIGVKVWIYKGEVYPAPKRVQVVEGGEA